MEEEVIVRTHEMKRARDEARAATRSKSDFLAAMSHEIRTPLNGVISMVDYLMEKRPPPDCEEALEIIAKSSDHLLTVINDILDYSKLEARKLKLEERPFDIRALVRDVSDVFACPAQTKGLRLETRLAPDLPALVVGDAARVRQIVFNLVSNAIKFTERGHVTVEVRIAHRASALVEEAQGLSLVLEVSNSGLGIDEDALRNLFTEFWQADTSISRRFGGSGLGLAICNRLAKQMGGEIKVISAPGAGSVFALVLPTKEVAAPASSTPKSQPTTGGWHGRLADRRILLVEDNLTNRRIARTMLAQTGAQIDTAEDGAEAVAAARVVAYDLILMDVHMPHMDGLAATEAIRALPAPFSAPPIIGLSASTFPEDQERCRRAGMSDFVGKPYRGRQLREAAARAMGVSCSEPDGGEPAGVSARPGETPIFDAPVFESEAFVTLGAELGEQDARELLKEFVDGAGERVSEMRMRLGRREAAAIKDIAHSLKSSSAMIGLSRLAEVAKEIERVAADADFDRLSPLQAAAEAALGDAQPFIEDRLHAA